jgi:hypothetical protein
MSQKTDDLDSLITSAVLKAIANESEIEQNPEIEAAWKKAVEIFKATGEKHE